MFVKCKEKNMVVNLLQSDSFGRNKATQVLAVFKGKSQVLGAYRTKDLADKAFDDLCDALADGDFFFDMPKYTDESEIDMEG